MLWKLLHLLFKWDYIHWENFADYGVARVHVDGKGKVYYWRYKSTKCLDIIEDYNKVAWLTCSPFKYFNLPKKNN